MMTPSHRQLNETQRELQARAVAFARDHVRAHAAERDRHSLFPREMIRALAEMGLMGINVSRTHGGLEAGVVAYSAVITAIAAADASVGVTLSVNNMVCEVLEEFGTPEQRERFIPRLTRGEYAGGSFCLSEPGSGSDAAAMLTRAVLKQGSWILDGTKSWITTGADAGVFLVWARAFTGEDDGKGAITAFVVDPNTPGVSVGKAESKMGQRGSHTVTLTFEQVRIPRESVLGEIGKGFRIAMMALDGGRIGVASLSLGIAEEAMRCARVELAAGRPHGALESSLMSVLARLAQDIEVSRQLVLHAAHLKEHKAARFTREASMAKLFASETASQVTEELAALFGASGTLERLVRDARVTRIYEGTSEVQRIVIARELLQELAD